MGDENTREYHDWHHHRENITTGITINRPMTKGDEGFDPSEVEERMAIEGPGSNGPGGGRQNPLALLVSVGARVEAMAGGSSAEAAQLQERRRMLRNVDAYLAKSEGVEKYRSEKTIAASRDPITGNRYKSAHEIARDQMQHMRGFYSGHVNALFA